MKAAEPRRLMCGRASRRGTAAAAAGAVEGPGAHLAAASGRTPGREGPRHPPQAGARPSEVRLTHPGVACSRAASPRGPRPGRAAWR